MSKVLLCRQIINMINISKILILILLSILYSCKGSNNNARIIKNWQGKELQLPAYLIEAINGDTIWTEDADFTIISYFDSLGCTSCKLHLSNWGSLFDRLNNNSVDTKLNSILLINTDKREDIRDLIDEEFYQYPVILDPNDSINHKNNFPHDEFFRSFLLDKDHKVIAIGNPLYSRAIEDLYFSIISGITNFSDDHNSGLTIDKTLHDFGNIPLGESVENTFKIKNIGNDTITISKIDSSCDCTTATTSSNFIAPGDSIDLTVSFREDSLTEEFFRTISIFYNNFARPTIFTITGTVRD